MERESQQEKHRGYASEFNRESARIHYCVMCGSLVEKNQGVVTWSLGFPFLFCSRECHSDYLFVNSVNARRLNHRLRDRARWMSQEESRTAISAA